MAKLAFRSYILIAALVPIALLLAARTVAAAAVPGNPVLVGRVTKVTDGDTLTVALSSGSMIVRLHSVDAPERDQTHGKEAFAALYAQSFGRRVELEVVEQDRYDRQVAVVYRDGVSINAHLVQQGHAWAYRDYLEDLDYCRWESNARAGKRGIWALPAVDQIAPWEWRDLRRGEVFVPTDYSKRTVEDCIRASGYQPTGSPGAPPGGQCLIKGNISDNGRIYHVPGSRSYDATVIDTSKGERWFCTEEDARAAGWRPPRAA